MSAKVALVTEKVKKQYEALPYPPRNPQIEKNMLHVRQFSSLDQVAHYCFEGKLSFPMRALVAGGGTGDSTIYLAEQLKQYGGSVVHIDISEASINIAKERAKIRKLDNIEWINDSLLNLPNLNLGLFDYIDCIGVLHHLADPQAGLDALAAVLKESGAMGIMVYAQYGRAAIYQMQEMFKTILPEEMDIPDKIAAAKNILGILPPMNWFKCDETAADDHISKGDSGLYDLFLHPQDRAYTVPQVYEFAEKSSLKLLGFVREYGMGKILYEPRMSIRDSKLLDLFSKMPVEKQHAAMELINVRGIKTHQFYLAKTPRRKLIPSDLSLIPFFSSYIDNAEANKIISAEVARCGETYQVTNNGRTVGQAKHPATHHLIEAIDNKRSVDEIVGYVNQRTNKKFARDVLIAEFFKIYGIFSIYDWLFLRTKDSKPLYVPHVLQINAMKRMAG